MGPLSLTEMSLCGTWLYLHRCEVIPTDIQSSYVFWEHYLWNVKYLWHSKVDSSGMLCCVSRRVVPDILKCCGAFMFRDKQSKKVATKEVLCYGWGTQWIPREADKPIGGMVGGASLYCLGVKVICRKKPNKHEPLQGALLDSTVKELRYDPDMAFTRATRGSRMWFWQSWEHKVIMINHGTVIKVIKWWWKEVCGPENGCNWIP